MPKNKPWYKKAIYIFIIIVLLFGVALLILHSQSTQTATAISEENYQPTDSSATDSLSPTSVNIDKLKNFIKSLKNKPLDTTNLDNQINNIINTNSDIVISVSVKDIHSGTIYNYGNSGSMTAASVTKVLTAVDYLKEVELGHKTLEQIMPDGNTAKYNIEQMIVYSDNDSWHNLNDSLTYTQIQSYAKSIGLNSYYYYDNTISTNDVTKLLGDLYERKLINESNTQLLLAYMERANFRDLIIPAVPEHDTVYHKAGWLYSYLNDSTIITNETNAIVLTIFTDSITNYDKARISAIMQQIATPTLETFKLN